MSSQLKSFLINLGENPDLLADFRANPDRLLADQSLAKHDSQLLIEGKAQELRDVARVGTEQPQMIIF